LARAATPSTVPIACSPTVSRRTVYSRPVPSAARTVSPERSRSTRERGRDSPRSNATRPSAMRSGVIVKRRTELQRSPAFHGQRPAENEPVVAEAVGDVGALAVEDAAEQQCPARQQRAGVLGAQPSMRGRQ